MGQGLMELLRPGPVALDTAIFIYFIEENPRYQSVIEPVFSAIARGEIQALTSELTLLEVLVVPFRKGDDAMAARYETFLSTSRGLHLVEMNRAIVRAAARIRATSVMKTPDSIQLATALLHGATCLLTNDRDLHPIGDLKIIQLEDQVRVR